MTFVYRKLIFPYVDEIERRERLQDSSLNALNLSQFPVSLPWFWPYRSKDSCRLQTLESRENDLEELVSVPQALRNSVRIHLA
jgi:hypothetical protein